MAAGRTEAGPVQVAGETTAVPHAFRIEVGGLYTPQDVSEQDFEENTGFPGAYPFTRGGLPDYVPGEAVDTTPDRRAGHGKLYQR